MLGALICWCLVTLTHVNQFSEMIHDDVWNHRMNQLTQIVLMFPLTHTEMAETFNRNH